MNLRERLGLRIPQGINQENSLWLHAVSVGEVLSLQNLIKQIKARHPDWAIYFSSLTSTGLQMAREKLDGLDAIFCVPLDFGFIIRRYLKALRPRLFILAESEFWPNLIREAKRRTRGVLLINGRISEKTGKRYSRMKLPIRKILGNIDLFLVQTEADKRRLLEVGIKTDRIKVAGNLKAELNLPDFPSGKIRDLKKNLGISLTKKVVVAGSTHKGEEEQLFAALAETKKLRDDIVLIIAPRHLERVNEILTIGKCLDLGIKLRTEVKAAEKWDVLILDTIGELAHFYALADIAFVGGSIVRWGGQNLLEPAFYGKPIFFGPYMENFAYFADKFLASKAAQLICNREDLLAMFLSPDEEYLETMGSKACVTLKSLQGATNHTLKAIEDRMK